MLGINYRKISMKKKQIKMEKNIINKAKIIKTYVLSKIFLALLIILIKAVYNVQKLKFYYKKQMKMVK